MTTRPTLARPHGLTKVAAAALSLLVALGIVSAITGLFQGGGTLLEQSISAERACARAQASMQARPAATGASQQLAVDHKA